MTGTSVELLGTTTSRLAVGDRVRAAGYLKDDGWATVESVDRDAKRVVVRFDDGDIATWRWGVAAKGRVGVVVARPANS
jgi:hypothetical protein